jgi:hypothetical protein
MIEPGALASVLTLRKVIDPGLSADNWELRGPSPTGHAFPVAPGPYACVSGQAGLASIPA